jgi:hypothetical protein
MDGHHGVKQAGLLVVLPGVFLSGIFGQARASHLFCFSLTPGLMGLERHLGQHPASSSEDPPAQRNPKKGSRTPNPIPSTPLIR